MVGFNKVILLGNLTRDPELRYTSGGNAVCSFGLAVSRRFRVENETRDEVCFVDITVWGRQAEHCNEYLNKGRSVLVEGRLNFRTWESDGQKRSKLDVVANTVQFLARPGTPQDPGRQQNTFPGKEEPGSSKAPGISGDEEIPF
ncbi:MAG: single-stranded DNA-binding protein [bacterium]